MCVPARVDQMCGPVCRLHLTAGIFQSGEKTHAHTSYSTCTLCNLAPLLAASHTLEKENDRDQGEIGLLKG